MPIWPIIIGIVIAVLIAVGGVCLCAPAGMTDGKMRENTNAATTPLSARAPNSLLSRMRYSPNHIPMMPSHQSQKRSPDTLGIGLEKVPTYNVDSPPDTFSRRL